MALTDLTSCLLWPINQQQQIRLFGYDSELNLNEIAQVTQPLDNVVPINQAALEKEQRQYDNAGRVVKVGRFTYHYDDCGRAISTIMQKMVSGL